MTTKSASARLLNVKLWLMAFLVMAAAALTLFHGPAQQTWTLDHDAGGRYPSSDCGPGFSLQLDTPFGCAQIKRVDADPVLKQATDQMKRDGLEQFDSQASALETLEDYIARVLEWIGRTWSGY